MYKIHDGDEDRFAVLDVGEDTPLVLISECNVNDCATLLPWAQDLIDTIGSVDSSP